MNIVFSYLILLRNIFNRFSSIKKTSDENFENNSPRPGGRHCSSKISRESDKTKTGGELLICKCVKWNRKKSMFGYANTKQEQRLCKFLRNLRNASAKASKKVATNVLKNSGKALEIGPKISNSVVGKHPTAAWSLFQDLNFDHTGIGLHLEEFV